MMKEKHYASYLHMHENSLSPIYRHQIGAAPNMHSTMF